MRRMYHTLLKKRKREAKYGTKASQQVASVVEEPVQEIAQLRETPPAPVSIPGLPKLGRRM